MKPAPFEYHAPSSAAEVVKLLAELGDGAKVIAGGQSLLPMLALRLAYFDHLVDLRHVAELRGIELRGSGQGGGGQGGTSVWIGAATTQAVIGGSAVVATAVPLLSRATPLIGHFQIRNRGTIGGSLAHAEAAAEYPAAALTLDAVIETLSPRGQRSIPAADFFTGIWSTAMEPDELLTGVQFPVWASGAGTNGTGTSGTGANGTGANGTGANGTGTNSAGTNSAGTNGTGTSGTGANGTGTNGTGTNSAGTNSAGANSAGASDGGACGFAVEEFARRPGDFAIAGAMVAVQVSGRGQVTRCGIGLFGLGPTPLRAAAAEAAAVGSTVGASASGASATDSRDGGLAREIGAAAMAGLGSVPDDLHGSAGYRKRVGAAMVARAWQRAVGEATGAVTSTGGRAGKASEGASHG